MQAAFYLVVSVVMVVDFSFESFCIFQVTICNAILGFLVIASVCLGLGTAMEV